MNTRFKVLSTAVIFALCYTILYIFFSPDGVLAHIEMGKEKILVEERVREKEGEVKLLRLRAQSEKREDEREKELVYSFSDEVIFDPVSSKDVEIEMMDGGYLETYKILIISLFVTLVYTLLIFLFIPLFKKGKKKWPR